jgi:hypothetical protein
VPEDAKKRYLPIFNLRGNRFFVRGGFVARDKEAALLLGYTRGTQVALRTGGQFTGEALEVEVGQVIKSFIAQIRGVEVCFFAGPVFERESARLASERAREAA